jgi:hypothetical protein
MIPRTFDSCGQAHVHHGEQQRRSWRGRIAHDREYHLVWQRLNDPEPESFIGTALALARLVADYRSSRAYDVRRLQRQPLPTLAERYLEWFCKASMRRLLHEGLVSIGQPPEQLTTLCSGIGSNQWRTIHHGVHSAISRRRTSAGSLPVLPYSFATTVWKSAGRSSSKTAGFLHAQKSTTASM